MSLTPHRFTTEEFFKIRIKGWMQKDIHRTRWKNNRINVGSAIIQLCVIDALGSLYTGKGNGKSKNNFILFVKDYFSSEYKKSERLNRLYRLRCGLVHQYFRGEREPLITDNYDSPTYENKHLQVYKNHFIINIDMLYKDLDEAIAKYKKSVIRNKNLYNRFVGRLAQLGITIKD